MSTPRDLEFDYEVTIVDGERGRRLATAQAQRFWTVLEWLQTP